MRRGDRGWETVGTQGVVLRGPAAITMGCTIRYCIGRPPVTRALERTADR
jgi:hypothetical protein